MPDTKDLKAALQHDLDRLASARDELRVQLSLAKAEAVEEWNKLETTWQRVEEEIKRAASHTKAPVHDMGAAARQLIEELKLGYERIRTQLKAQAD
jgi:predicted  nucleic acid-binding Zn-ribbon protein